MFLFLALFVVALLLTYLVPFWWAFVPAAVVLGALLGRRPLQAFGQGFAALFLVWVLASAITALSTGSPIGPRMATLLPAGGSTVVLILLQGVIGGLVSGLAAAGGTALRRALRPAEA